MTEPVKKCPSKTLEMIRSTGDQDRGFAQFYLPAPQEHSVKDVMGLEYFGAHVTVPGASNSRNNRKIRVGDEILVIPDGLAWRLELQVTMTNHTLGICQTRQIALRRFDEDIGMPDGWSYEWLGGTDHYAIFYNGEKRDAGLPSPDAAAARARAMNANAVHAIQQAEPKPKRVAKPEAVPEANP